jgi:hypothetical protein
MRIWLEYVVSLAMLVFGIAIIELLAFEHLTAADGTSGLP